MPQTNHNEILASIGSALAGITVAGGFDMTVATVLEHYKEHTLFAPAELPVAMYYPAPDGGIPATRYPFNSYEEYLDVLILMHIPIDFTAADYDTRRRIAIGIAKTNILNAMTADPERGGWAIDTEKVNTTQTDEGTIAKDGADNQVASLVLRFRVTYYPND